MAEHLGYHDLPVLFQDPGIVQNLGDVILVHGDDAATLHPLVEIALSHGSTPGIHARGELCPPRGIGGSALLGGRDEIVRVSHRNPSSDVDPADESVLVDVSGMLLR